MGKKLGQQARLDLTVLDVGEDSVVSKAVDAAYVRWYRADEAWPAVTWALARDPYSAGPPLSESGLVRTFVFEGARAFGMPTVRAVYVIEPDRVVIKGVIVEASAQLHAGRA